MAVNVSARQLQHPEFVGHVEQALAESGFPPRCLTLELTESVLLASGEHTEQRLAALKASGISLALDDFGTGYASLVVPAALPGRHRQDRPQLHRFDRHRDAPISCS